jgi:isopentenyl-diphosphate Delta-isomerase
VIIKDVGFGLSFDAARTLRSAGAAMLDVAGAGGTSWVKITKYVNDGFDEETLSGFEGWGIPTADSLITVGKAVNDIPIIASGGIRSGLDMAKAIAMGAHFAGMAYPLLAPAIDSAESVIKVVTRVIRELKAAMFCCGALNIDKLRGGSFIRRRNTDPSTLPSDRL